MKWVFADETAPYSQHNVSVCGATPFSGNISWAAAVKFRLFNQQIISFQLCSAVLNCSAESRENSRGTTCMDCKLKASSLSNFLVNQDNKSQGDSELVQSEHNFLFKYNIPRFTQPRVGCCLFCS